MQAIGSGRLRSDGARGVPERGRPVVRPSAVGAIMKACGNDRCTMCHPIRDFGLRDLLRVIAIGIVCVLAVASLSVKSCDWEPLEPSTVGFEAR